MLTYETWEENVVSFSEEDETKGALSVLKWAYKEYKDEIVYACSFGVEGMVLLHLINQVNPSAKVVFLDTNVHFQETYELIQKVRRRFPSLNIIENNRNLRLMNKRSCMVRNYGKVIRIFVVRLEKFYR